MPKQKFAGPCSVCGNTDPSGYYRKKMCHNCYRKQQRRERGLRKGSPKQYEGPCTVCGESPEGARYIRKMCVNCYRRVHLRGGNVVPREKFTGPCVVCGTTDVDRYYNKRCPACYQYERRNGTERPLESQSCVACGKQISRISRTGMCPACRNRERYWADPEVRRRVIGYALRYQGQFRDAEKTLTEIQWLAIADYYEYRCAYCDIVLTPETFTQDHVIPLSKGGKHSADNVVPCCKSCNVRKGDGPPPRPPLSLEGTGII